MHRSAAAREAFPFWIEGKNTKQLSIGPWWKKLQEDRSKIRDADPGIIIAKLYKSNRAIVVLDLEEFLDTLYGPLTDEQRDLIRHWVTLKEKKEPT